MTRFSAFLNDEAGAVTVDWVVLTAAIVGLGMVVFTLIAPEVESLADLIGQSVAYAGALMLGAG